METANAESASQRAPQPERAKRGIDRFLHLQQAIGNRATQSLLAGGLLQPKLRIGPVDDVYEREADRTADRVMRMAEPASADAQPFHSPISRVQRMCAECEEEEKEEEEEEGSIQRKPRLSGASPVKSSVESRMSSLRGGGQPLPPAARSFFEPRFGHDFSHVRLHTGATAAGAAAAINARAFTLGRDIVFNAGEYAPHSNNGFRLLGHELTHVLQQSGDSRLIRPRLIQRAQTGRPTSQAAYFTYELDTTRSTYGALASHYGLDRWQDIRDATPGRPAASALRMGQALRIPARNLPTGTVQVVGTEPALVVTTGTAGINFRWGNNSNANRIGRASRGTATDAGATVPNSFRRAWIESSNLQNRADGVIAELQARTRTAGTNVYGYLPTSNVRLASRVVPATDVDILARMIFGEQASEGRAAMVVAAWIVRNRYDAGWGGSYDVLLTDREFHALRTNRTRDMTTLTGPNARSWTTAQQVAQGVVDGTIADPTAGRGFYFGNGSTVQQRMAFCQRNNARYRTAQVTGTNLFWSNGDYTGGTVAAPNCGPPQGP
ncbi:MAG: DUF4157 domain-containing protein [Phycisphaerales bacterium]